MSIFGNDNYPAAVRPYVYAKGIPQSIKNRIASGELTTKAQVESALHPMTLALPIGVTPYLSTPNNVTAAITGAPIVIGADPEFQARAAALAGCSTCSSSDLPYLGGQSSVASASAPVDGSLVEFNALKVDGLTLAVGGLLFWYFFLRKQ